LTKTILSALILSFLLAVSLLAQVPEDSLPPAPSVGDTMYVIPAGPVAGTFTAESRLTVEDTVAGWARIRVEGWVPVGYVMGRLDAGNQIITGAFGDSREDSVVRQRCTAITQKGTRCKRMAEPGTDRCWQHRR